MEKKEPLINLINDITNEETLINNYLINLKSEGILDEPLESYLLKSIEDFRTQKQSIIKDFKLTQKLQQSDSKTEDLEIIELKPSKSSPNYPVLKYSNTTPEPKQLFKKTVSPVRRNSPSALRYSPRVSP